MEPRLTTFSKRRASLITTRLLAWYALHARDLPWRKTRDPYAIWISEMMLQQTQVQTVIAYYERWMRELPTLASLAGAPLGKVLQLWAGLGYYSRARNLHRAAHIIADKHQGKLPADHGLLLGLPGIGRYSAGAICSIAFNQPTPVLDGNVVRVLTRLQGILEDPKPAPVRDGLWAMAELLVRQASSASSATGYACGALNQSLMELGATVCIPANPNCAECPLRACCQARRQGLTSQIPYRTQSQPAKRMRLACFLVESQNRFLVRQKSPGEFNAGLWEFPTVEIKTGAVNPAELIRAHFGFLPDQVEKLGLVRHRITCHQIAIQIFRVHGEPPIQASAATSQWLDFPQLAGLAFSGAHRKILALLEGQKSG